nr:hypothetical protein Iba_scaffold665CG0200 [Ipomoea batatas]
MQYPGPCITFDNFSPNPLFHSRALGFSFSTPPSRTTVHHFSLVSHRPRSSVLTSSDGQTSLHRLSHLSGDRTGLSGSVDLTSASQPSAAVLH